MKKILIAAVLVICFLTAGIIAFSYADDKTDLRQARLSEEMTESIIKEENDVAKTTQRNIYFENGDRFWIKRYEFKTKDKKPYYSSFTIPGKNIKIQYMTTVGNKKRWVEIKDPAKLNTSNAKTTLFISTDRHSMIIGIPAVYKAQDSYGNINAVVNKEKPISISKAGEDSYAIKFTFARDENYIGEIWALQSAKPLFVLDESEKQLFTTNDLAGKWRLSMQGYYQKTYDSYIPTGPNVYFRQPACYAGGTFLRVRNTNATYDLGYVLMKICSENQTQLGYIPTPARSTWLYRDFKIQENFFDTRFNTDFGINLIDAYYVYGDEYFLQRAKNYGDFYVNYASDDDNIYRTKNGILVSDYWHELPHLKTHVSLNHHLAGLNFLLQLYGFTGDERYHDTAIKMTKGVEDTETEWILPNKDLRYALYYTGPNKMVDYPYLTYNDLYTTNNYLQRYAKTYSTGIIRLLEAKLQWMKANDVHGYMGEEQ